MTATTTDTEEVTLRLPRDLIARLNEAAAHRHAPIESVISELLNISLPPMQSGSDAEFEQRLRELSGLNEEQLQATARTEMQPKDKERGRELLALNKERQLSATERAELDSLQDKGDAVAVTRAAAMWLLKQSKEAMGHFA